MSEFKPGQRVILRKTGETGTVFFHSQAGMVAVIFDDDPPNKEWRIPAHKLDHLTGENT